MLLFGVVVYRVRGFWFSWKTGCTLKHFLNSQIVISIIIFFLIYHTINNMSFIQTWRLVKGWWSLWINRQMSYVMASKSRNDKLMNLSTHINKSRSYGFFQVIFKNLALSKEWGSIYLSVSNKKQRNKAIQKKWLYFISILF